MKDEKLEKRKRDKKAKEEEVIEPEEKTAGRKKKKRKEKPLSQMFNESCPWQTNSDESDELPDEVI